MSHAINDKISLELSLKVAEQLVKRPELVVQARATLERWIDRNKEAPALVRNYREWLAILDLPIPKIIEILTSLNDESQRLRSNSPFTGVLTSQEVLEIKKRIRHDETAA